MGEICFFFQSSGKYDIQIFKDEELLNKDEYILFCIHESLFNFNCFFQSKGDILPGKYEIFTFLQHNSELKINQTIHVTIPSKKNSLSNFKIIKLSL